MLEYILLIFLITCILYAYSRDDRLFASTATGLQEVWCNSCRLRCRRLRKQVYTVMTETAGGSENPGSSRPVAVHQSCICESCPCALVEAIIDTCKPVTKTYAFIVAVIFQAYYDFIEMTVEMYDRLLFILMQNQETRRSSQLTAPIESSKIKIRNKPISRQDVSLRREDDRTEPRTSGRNDRDDVERSEYDNNIPDSDCPACVEKGLTCIGRCPAERSKRE
ncbi:uncharacterized protein LOC106719513 [Papilio machaon]|uniref:uncharacterized protein LOC106719513 n=1 Tax=Papilio machaon TaxID=76193 RepID=UPI001E662DDA|nr:uncharacterized protein LOC106719513 [Papilio machaon]